MGELGHAGQTPERLADMLIIACLKQLEDGWDQVAGLSTKLNPELPGRQDHSQPSCQGRFLRLHRPREGQRGIDLRINIATSYTTKSTGPGLGWRNNVHRCAKTYSARIAATAQRLRWCEFPAEAAMRVSRGYGGGGQRAVRTGFSMWLWVSGRGGRRPPPADRPGSRNRQD